MKRYFLELNNIPKGFSRFRHLKAVATFFFTVLIFAALALASDPPWKGKPYNQWTDKDLEKIFTDSPWSRIGTVTRTWAPPTANDIPAYRPANGQTGVIQPSSPMAGAGSGGPAAPSGSNTSSAPVGDDLRFNVYWASSRVMRAARARKSVLHGGKQDMDVAKYAGEPQEEYQVVVQSADMTPFVRRDEKFFQDNSFLDVKKTKQKISPSHVRYERDDKGMVGAAVFFFPKKTAAGEPTVPTDEKNVEFNCKLEGSKLSVSFDPQKMVDQSGPAL